MATTLDNPLLNAQRFLPSGNTGPILAWVKEAVAEGEGMMSQDPVWTDMDRNMDYINGRQKAKAVSQERPSYVSHAVVNETRRTARRHVSALTDIKPVYAYRTPNPNFQQQAMLLNQLTTVWWINTFADLALADAVWYAAACGCGDLVCEYDQFYGPMGDMVLYPRDPRDTIPIRPSRDASIQSWFGCILREAHSYNMLAGMYPEQKELLKRSASPWGAGVFTKFKSAFNKIMGGGATTTLSGLTKTYTGQQRLSGDEVILYKVFLNDPAVNSTDRPIMMGKAGTSWSYTVQPGDRLYPRKRLIVCTEGGILFDGPSPYWHGMFPVARLKLCSVPWSFFGLPLVDIQVPIQDAINDSLNYMLDNVRQKLRPPKVANSRVPEPALRQFDPLNPRAQLRTQEQVGTGFQFAELPELPAFTFELFTYLRGVIHDLSGDSTLDALQAAAANQSFDPESIEAWMNALSPELKLEGRQVELCLRHLADMGKSNIFQFYDAGRRMQVLGDAGMTLQDLDYDPGDLIPAMQPGEQGYLPQLDVQIDKKDRAEFFLKLFTFYVTPNSLLALNAQAEKLKYTMMMRAGICDVWTFWEKMEVPNAGQPPLMYLPAVIPVNPELLPEIAAGLVPGQQIDPNNPNQVLELRRPVTITERLQAQALMGLGMNQSPVGQKASGQTSPGVEVQKNPDGSQRIKMTESPKDHHPTAGRKAETAASGGR